MRERIDEYIAALPRHDRILAKRFLDVYRDNPRSIAEMGFFQYLESLNGQEPDEKQTVDEGPAAGA